MHVTSCFQPLPWVLVLVSHFSLWNPPTQYDTPACCQLTDGVIQVRVFDRLMLRALTTEASSAKTTKHYNIYNFLEDITIKQIETIHHFIIVLLRYFVSFLLFYRYSIIIRANTWHLDIWYFRKAQVKHVCRLQSVFITYEQFRKCIAGSYKDMMTFLISLDYYSSQTGSHRHPKFLDFDIGPLLKIHPHHHSPIFTEINWNIYEIYLFIFYFSMS